ncbi:MAG: hypothetical protein ABGZ35_00680 [Planctomycetaceae bacterium]|jgi:hypothetical protein
MRPAPDEQLTIADILRSLGENVGAQASDADLQQLVDTLRAQGQQYETLLTLLETLNSSANVNETHSQAVLNSIQHQLSNLETTRDTLSALQRRVGDVVTKSSPALQKELSRQERMLQSCLSRISDLESHFVDRRKRLQPELDESAKRRSMHTAYQRSLNTG